MREANPSISSTDVDELLRRSASGDKRANDELFAQMYRDLHELARCRVWKLGSPAGLSPSTILHEAYLQVAKRTAPATFDSRAKYFAYIGKVMRGLVVDHIRATRGRHGQRAEMMVTLDTDLGDRLSSDAASGDVEGLMAAMTRLEEVDERLAAAFDLVYVVGLRQAEAALHLEVSLPTVERRLRQARGMLRMFLANG